MKSASSATITAAAAITALVASVAAQPIGTTYDDAQVDKINYQGGNWTHLTNQGIVNAGTESYSPDGSAYFTVNEVSSVIQIWGGKKADRGYWDVYADDLWLGYGDALDVNCVEACPSELLFSTFLPSSTETVQTDQVITIRNRPYDYRLKATPVIDLDYIIFTS